MSRFLSFLLLLLTAGSSMAQEIDPSQLRTEANRLMMEGNWKEAYERFEKLIRNPNEKPESVVVDLGSAIQCQNNLNQQLKLDGLLNSALEAHPKQWRILHHCAKSLNGSPHYGLLNGTTFTRNPQGGQAGRWVDYTTADRQQALQWYAQAIPLIDANASKEEVSRFHLGLMQTLLIQRSGNLSWLLQTKTDVEGKIELPDMDSPNQQASSFAPVDEKDQPILYQIPADWNAAKNDGERIRWALLQAIEMDENVGDQALYEWAGFLHSQFSVDTLQESQWMMRSESQDADSSTNSSGHLAIHTLSDDEAIAKLASGIRRFKLPDDSNPIRIYQKLALKESLLGDTCLMQLARTFTNRRQFSKGADLWRESIRRFGNQDYKSQPLQEIEEPRGTFDPVSTQPAGKAASLGFLFRNAKTASLTASQVDVEKIFEATKKFYRNGDPRKPEFAGNKDSYPPFFDMPNELFQNVELKQFVSQPVANWDLKLDPRADHWDRRIEVETPIKKAGLYVITCRLDGTHTSRTLLWIQDTAIVRKTLDDGASLYFVADALDGKPIANMNLEFFGFTTTEVNGKPIFKVNGFAKKSNPLGQVTVKSQELEGFQWMVVARDSKGRFASMGLDAYFSPFGGGYGGGFPGGGIGRSPFEQPSSGWKAFGVSDRPVYRPGDTIHGKIWIGNATYDPNVPVRPSVGAEYRINLVDQQGTSLFKQAFKTDRFGSIEFEIPTTKKVALGVYTAQVLDNQQWIQTNLHFRIEEYRKPEFEVTVVAPTEPVALGETIRAKVRAKYFFGSPVSEGTAVIRVQRTAFQDTYYPAAPFDWCYGPGYWWFGYNYDWYPGWRRWRSCVAPDPWWFPRSNQDPPELVYEKTVSLDASGEAQVVIDTAIAKTFQGNSDHRYSITAEVRDASRRTIVASGETIAAVQPFKVYTWLNHGYLQVGKKATAHFSARTVAGKGVSGKGTVELLQIRYNGDREPQEKVIQQWKAAADEDGRVEQVFQIDQSGQYRIRMKFTDLAGHEIEGGYVFTVHGPKGNGGDFRYNAIELVPDQAHYSPGQKVRLMINANRDKALVLLFVRPESGIYKPPQVVQLDGKSKLIELDVSLKDQPNFFVEALTIYDGVTHETTREIFVPPETRMLDVQAKIDREEYRPGEEAKIDLVVKDSRGEPVEGSTVVAVYDRSIDSIAPDMLPGDIREFFWKWRRGHSPSTTENLARVNFPIGLIGSKPWSPLGIFGANLADDAEALDQHNTLKATASNNAASIKQRSGVPGIPRYSIQRNLAVGGSEGGMMRGYQAGGFGGGGMGEAVEIRAREGAVMDMAGAPMAKDMANSAEPVSMAPTSVRKDFADTAFWIGTLVTDREGRASVNFKMPENVTSWKVRTWTVGESLRVGSTSAEVVTRKNLLVRLQAPRFLVQRDRVVLSSLVNNDLAEEVDAKVRLEIDGETNLRLADGVSAEQTIHIDSHGQARVDWECIALAEGEVTLRTIASTPIESDAMQIKLPILVHGFLKTDSYAGTVRSNQEAGSTTLDVPNERRIEQSELIVRLSPSLAASMIDALPYLADYPYGCTEQTLNRFLPTVVTQRVLQEMNVDLKKLAERKTNLNAQELGHAQQRVRRWQRFDRNPVYDVDELNAMVQSGVKRLTDMQVSDGGWGWFSGVQEQSYPHTTAVVVRGLLIAQQNDVALIPGTIERGLQWLERYQAEQLQLFKNKGNDQLLWRDQVNDMDALIFSILVDAGKVDAEFQAILYEKRLNLNVYGKALLAMAIHKIGNKDQLAMLRQNIEQFLVEDEENETARINAQAPWWYWYGSEIEATAIYLKLLSRIDPKGKTAPRVVKFLLNNRKHATYWNSTRDTALVVEAFADYMRATGETKGNVTADVYLDDARIGKVEFTADNLFEVDNTIHLEGNAIPTGKHRLEIRRQGEGPIYWNAYLTNFTLEEEIAPAGLELKVARKYYLLKPVVKDQAKVGDRGQVGDGKRSAYDRTELKELDEIPSGSLVEVEVTIESKNDYEYILLEDTKGASLEPVETQSGYAWEGGITVYREFRDQKVSHFFRMLPIGSHSIRYRMRAEAPGTFTALPAVGEGMYAPELRGSSSDSDLKVTDLRDR